MRKKNRVIRLFLWIFLLACLGNTIPGTEKAGDFPVLKGPYLGQKPPGMAPEVFAPGIISTGKNEGCSAFSLDGKLFIFRRSSKTPPDIYMMKQVNGQWSKPEVVPF